MQTTEKKELKAIHTVDLDDLLKKFNQYEHFVTGRLTCSICNDTLKKDRLGTLRLTNQKLVFTCNKLSCINHLTKN